MKKCFNGNTSYQLLIFLLLIQDKIESNYFIFHNTFEKKILDKIKNKKIIKTKSKIKNQYILIFFKIYFLFRIKIGFLIGEFNKYKKMEIYGESLYSILFKTENSKIYLLEDGAGNYALPKEIGFNLKEKIYRMLATIIFMKKLLKYGGRSKEVDKIYLTGLAPIPNDIKRKVELINLKELWNKKTLEEQNEILNIFSFDLDIKKKIKGKDIILFTQPLSEDKIITEKEKVEIYSKIIKKYPKDKLIIKKHPREKTDYKDLFKENLVLDNPFPFEILNLLEVKFRKTITIFSTAALGLGEEVEVDFYGTEVHKEILKKFGSYKKIYPTTKFIIEEE